MTGQRADIETDTDLSPDESARLLEAVRRAREDLAAGRMYRVDEAFLRRLGDAAEVAGRPLTRGEVLGFAGSAMELGEIERAMGTGPGAPADAAAGA